MIGDEGGCNIVLRGKRVGGAQANLRATLLEGEHEICRFGRDVQAGGDALAFERALLTESLLYQFDDGHFPRGPLDAALAAISKGQVGYVMGGIGNGHR